MASPGDAAELPARQDCADRPETNTTAETTARQRNRYDSDEQFTLGELFWMMNLSALIVFPMSYLPRPWFAGLTGGLTLLWMLIQTVFEPRRALLRYAWCLLLVLYLTACAMAVMEE